MAANTSQLKDFAELDLENLYNRQEDEESIVTFDSNKTDDNKDDDDVDGGSREGDDSSDGHTVDKRSFLRRMFHMGQKQRWIEALSRRYQHTPFIILAFHPLRYAVDQARHFS